MEKPSATCETPIRVRYAETDQMGVSYYANYLIWFEAGRSDFCRQLGFSYREMEKNDGRFLSVAQVKCRYHAPSTYDDELTVRTTLKACRKRVVIFSYKIYKAGGKDPITTGETVHIVTNRAGRPSPLPEKYFQMLSSVVAEESKKGSRPSIES